MSLLGVTDQEDMGQRLELDRGGSESLSHPTRPTSLAAPATFQGLSGHIWLVTFPLNGSEIHTFPTTQEVESGSIALCSLALYRDPHPKGIKGEDLPLLTSF